ncbi:hypothetical protein [Nocardioides sp. T2.26MG-1]|uniref:hypothetical protein n=1 Tax=Nocardioides sp. T2.26MG-1 TaxID=3041166 RepID=UPI0024775ECE|nr:hypothetical protein [Nocardioides sp. T2.26MG-1]CAI9398663.1 hypothetical protein HIDPHFAB_00041 [Nocardioides sp. T2.26MG-1]
MYFAEALAVLARRWYVVVVCAIAIVAGLVVAVKEVPTQYQASGQVLLLLPPTATGKGTPSNPYLNLQPGLTTMATITAAQLNSKPEQRSFVEAGFTSDYAIGVSPDTGPLLLITVKDIDPVEAAATRDEVIARVTRELFVLQEGLDVPDTQRVYPRTTSAPPAEVVPGAKIRAMAVIGGGGLVATIILAFLLDRLLRRRPGGDDEEEQQGPDQSDPDEGRQLKLATPVAPKEEGEGTPGRTKRTRNAAR